MLGEGRGGDVERLGDAYQRWPFSAADEEGTDVLHAETFATGERTAPLAVVDPVPLANALTGDALDPEAKIPEFKHSAVAVDPVPGRDAADAD